jgi:hypothetical protein
MRKHQIGGSQKMTYIERLTQLITGKPVNGDELPYDELIHSMNAREQRFFMRTAQLEGMLVLLADELREVAKEMERREVAPGKNSSILRELSLWIDAVLAAK